MWLGTIERMLIHVAVVEIICNTSCQDLRLSTGRHNKWKRLNRSHLSQILSLFAVEIYTHTNIQTHTNTRAMPMYVWWKWTSKYHGKAMVGSIKKTLVIEHKLMDKKGTETTMSSSNKEWRLKNIEWGQRFCHVREWRHVDQYPCQFPPTGKLNLA